MAAVTNVFTDTITVTYSGNGKSVSTKTGTYTGSKDAGVAAVIAAGGTNVEVDITFPHGTIQALILASDQDVTVKTNSSSSPTDTLAVKKTAGVIWGTDFVADCPITADVTKLYITNAGTTDAKFDLRVLYN